MSAGKLLIVAGLLIAAVGVMLILGERLPIRLGRLPGDMVWRGKNSVVYFPLVTSIILSVIFSAVLWLIGRR